MAIIEMAVVRRPDETYQGRTRRARNTASALRRRGYETQQRSGVITTQAPVALLSELIRLSK
jgi:hypothetical protein